MQAAWYERMGPAREVLSLGELPMPEPGHGEVLIKIGASGVNPHDTKRRSGWLGPAMYAPRVVPHSDGAGTVAALGPGVGGVEVGDRVFVYRAGSTRPGEGTAAEYVAVQQANVVRLPDTLSLAEGACLGVPAFTAYHATLSDGPVSGQVVLVQGGAGAVGVVAIEMARWSGATVIATVSSPEKAAIARAAGADHTIDYTRDDVAARVMEITGGAGVERIVEVDFGANVAIDARGDCRERHGGVLLLDARARAGAALLRLRAQGRAVALRAGHEHAARRSRGWNAYDLGPAGAGHAQAADRSAAPVARDRGGARVGRVRAGHRQCRD